jgi:hypothetical protein
VAEPRIITRPLLTWPGQLRDDDDRKPNPFTATHGDTMDLLRREARLLGAHEIVVQLAITEAEIRLDGEPYARAKAKHPGVTVVLPESAQGRISWSTDAYRGGNRWTYAKGTTRLEGWQVNLRAIALSMEALRAADRHGVMQGRQYAGFRELGSGIEAPEHVMTVEDAARFIAEHTPASVEAVLGGGKPREMAIRFAAKRLHPDTGGDAALFARLQEAKEVLERHG